MANHYPKLLDTATKLLAEIHAFLSEGIKQSDFPVVANTAILKEFKPSLTVESIQGNREFKFTLFDYNFSLGIKVSPIARIAYIRLYELKENEKGETLKIRIPALDICVNQYGARFTKDKGVFNVMEGVNISLTSLHEQYGEMFTKELFDYLLMVEKTEMEEEVEVLQTTKATK